MYTRTSSPLPLNLGGMKVQEALVVLNGLTRWEMQLILCRTGWIDVESTKRKVDPITAQDMKRLDTDDSLSYYYGGTLLKHYLMCLILLGRLFQHGLKEFHHFQLQNYYAVLIDCLQTNPDALGKMVPNQPMAFYKEQKTRNHDGETTRKGRKRKANNKTSDLPEGFEVEVSLTAAVPEAKSECKQQRRRGRGRGRGRSRGRGRGRDGQTSNAASAAVSDVRAADIDHQYDDNADVDIDIDDADDDEEYGNDTQFQPKPEPELPPNFEPMQPESELPEQSLQFQFDVDDDTQVLTTVKSEHDGDHQVLSSSAHAVVDVTVVVGSDSEIDAEPKPRVDDQAFLKSVCLRTMHTA